MLELSAEEIRWRKLPAYEAAIEGKALFLQHLSPRQRELLFMDEFGEAKLNREELYDCTRLKLQLMGYENVINLNSPTRGSNDEQSATSGRQTHAMGVHTETGYASRRNRRQS